MDTGTLQHKSDTEIPNAETSHTQNPSATSSPAPSRNNPTPDPDYVETQNLRPEVFDFSLPNNVIPPPVNYSEFYQNQLISAVALPTSDNFANLPTMQNVIQFDANDFGSHTRISSFTNRSSVASRGQFNTFTTPTNMAVSIQSPAMSSNISVNRYSMIPVPEPQQFEINVYNTLPQAKSYHEIYSSEPNQFFPHITNFPPPIDLSQSLVGVPPPPVDIEPVMTTDTVLLDDVDILKVPPPPPIDFELEDDFSFDSIPPPLPPTPPPPLSKTPSPTATPVLNKGAIIPILETVDVTDLPPPVPPLPLEEEMNQKPLLPTHSSIHPDVSKINEKVLVFSQTKTIPSLLPKPKKIPPPVPVKRSTLSRAFHSEEKLLDSDGPKEKINFSKPVVSTRPQSLIFSSNKLAGFNSATLGKYGTAQKVILFLTPSFLSLRFL